MSKRLKICLSLWFAVLALSLCSGQTFAQEQLPLAPSPDASIAVQMTPVPVAPEGSQTELPPPVTFVPSAPVAMVPNEEWSIQITPALKLKSAVTSPQVQLVEPPQDGQLEDVHQPTMSREEFASAYQRVYNSIPFRRAEYNRNPTYRHDSAMEILTGNARHQTIVNHQPQQVVRPAARTRRQTLNPAQFGYLRPALRLNYYRYFPSLNPYLNAYNLSGAF